VKKSVKKVPKKSAVKRTRKIKEENSVEVVKEQKEFRPRPYHHLRLLVKTYYDVQAVRTLSDNRLKRKKDGTKQKLVGDDYTMLSDAYSLIDVWSNTARETEETIQKSIKKMVSVTPLWKEFLVNVKGVGPMLAAVILSEYDIERATTVSKMCAFTGLVPGKDKLVKGQTSCFNSWLRTRMCGVLADSFIKSNSPYRKFYDDYKNRKEQAEWGKSKGHRDRAARRYMIKAFLKDLYVAWRTLEGLEVRVPYEEEYLGRAHHR